MVSQVTIKDQALCQMLQIRSDKEQDVVRAM